MKIGEEKPRGEIVKIGTVTEDGFLEGWEFRGEGLEISFLDFKDGGAYATEISSICGYTLEELRGIAAAVKKA